MGRYPERTILVEIGELRPFSDISGLHVIKLDNSTQKRQELADRLELAGCQADRYGVDWHTEGDFEAAIEGLPQSSIPNSPATKLASGLRLDLRLEPVFREANPKYLSNYELEVELKDAHSAIIYGIEVSIVNSGSIKAVEYQVDVQFPSCFLPRGISNVFNIPKRDDRTHKYFRITQDEIYEGELYPGDKVTAFTFYYLMTEELFQNDLANQKVKAAVYSGMMIPEKLEQSIKEITGFWTDFASK